MQLLGFPIQLVGLISLPVLGVRYLAEGENFQQDAKAAAVGFFSKLVPVCSQGVLPAACDSRVFFWLFCVFFHTGLKPKLDQFNHFGFHERLECWQRTYERPVLVAIPLVFIHDSLKVQHHTRINS